MQNTKLSKLQPGQVAKLRHDCLDPDCTKLVPLRVEQHYDHEARRYHTTRLTEQPWQRTPLMVLPSSELPRPGGKPWGAVQWPCPPPTRAGLLARGFIRPAGHGVPYVALDEAALRAHRTEHAAYLQDPAAWQRAAHPAAEDYEQEQREAAARALQPEARAGTEN